MRKARSWLGRVARTVVYAFVAAQLMGEGFGNDPVSGCASCGRNAVLLAKEGPYKPPPPAPAVPRWSVEADAGARTLSFSPAQPSRTFTIRVETSLPAGELAKHQLTVAAAAIFPVVTAATCKSKCCHSGGDCTCLADVGRDGDVQFARGSLESPGTLSESTSTANAPGCSVSSPVRRVTAARTFTLRPSMDPAAWTCDATAGICAAAIRFTLTASDPSGKRYTGVLRVSGGKHQVVPYDPGSNPVSVSFAGSLVGTGAETPPAGLRFAMMLLEP